MDVQSAVTVMAGGQLDWGIMVFGLMMEDNFLCCLPICRGSGSEAAGLVLHTTVESLGADLLGHTTMLSWQDSDSPKYEEMVKGRTAVGDSRPPGDLE